MLFSLKKQSALLACTALLLTTTSPAMAHHEAIFGPQSSSILSNANYAAFQIFTRQTGTGSERTQETTPLVTVGVTPVKDIPLSVSVIAPASSINGLDGQGGNISGIEDILFSARYRYDLEYLQNLWGREGNYIMGMAGVEIPNGVIDHPSFQGPIDSMGAMMGSLEYGPFSAIAYTFYRHNAANLLDKSGDNLFTGGGIAYTPVDDQNILSFQLSFSYETYFADVVNGAIDDQTGGRGLLLHPTIYYSPGYNVSFFGVLSLPAWQSYADPTAQDRFRIGTGVIYQF